MGRATATGGIRLGHMGTEWFVIAGVVLLLFGGTQIPKLARSLGQAQKEFKHGQDANAEKGADSERGDAPPKVEEVMKTTGPDENPKS